MGILFNPTDGCCTNAADDFDGVAGVVNTETFPGQGAAVDFCMEVGETIAEFDLITVHNDGTEGALVLCQPIHWDVFYICGEKPMNFRSFQFKYAGTGMWTRNVSFQMVKGTEEPVHHIKEMHTDVTSNSTAFLYHTFPRT